MKQGDLKFVSNNMKNLLENVTLRKYKSLIGLKEEMISLGSVGTLMSGSGPSVFGFFDDITKAQKCYDKMKEKYTDVFITRTI